MPAPSASQNIASDSRHSNSKAGKYLTYMLGEEFYGIEIHKVREIVGLINITPVPRTLPYIVGVVNLRGHVIPVMDLRTRLDLAPAEATDLTCIIVVELQDNEIGMIVDRVCDVMDVEDPDIDEPPTFGMSLDTNFIRGISKAGERVTILLDVDKILTSEEAEQIEHDAEQMAAE